MRKLYEFYLFYDRYFINDRKCRVKNITQYLKNDRYHVDVLLFITILLMTERKLCISLKYE